MRWLASSGSAGDAKISPSGDLQMTMDEENYFDPPCEWYFNNNLTPHMQIVLRRGRLDDTRMHRKSSTLTKPMLSSESDVPSESIMSVSNRISG